MEELQSIHLSKTTRLRLMVWRIRHSLGTILGKDLLDPDSPHLPGYKHVRHLYLKFDAFLLKHLPRIERDTPPKVALERVRHTLHHNLGYDFYEVDETRPWGGFYRIIPEQTDKFLADFFPGLTQEEARMGKEGIELSPKIMVWLPGARISWQYHHYRAERWHFLTDGTYWRSMKDKLPEPIQASAGEVVQFETGERHRGGAPDGEYVLVAEIWQHTDPKHFSDETDVVRLADDYHRPKHPKRPQ